MQALVGVQPLLVGVYSAGLCAVGVWHIVAGDATERLFHDARRVRLVGGLLLLMSLPCLLWRGDAYFVVMAVVLGASGAMRLFTPRFNIRLQKGLYSRRVHGWIMTIGGVVTWVAYRWFGHP